MILGGDLDHVGTGGHDVGVGVIGSLQGSARLLRQRGARPFINASLSFSASRTTTTPMAGGSKSTLVATDLRAGVMIGYRFLERFTVHGAARGFGGPVFWDNVEDPGNDKHFFQIGAGASAGLPGGFRVFTEWAFLGERNLTMGAGKSF